VTDQDMSIPTVNIKNWPDPPAKPPYVKRTTLHTYVVDPAGAVGPDNVQIAAYEPNRYRMVVQSLDGATAILVESPPSTHPDSNSPNTAVTGMYMPASTALVHEFFGPDAFWINSLSAITRVSVLKEYC
jgi:hypothetical protein